MTLRGFTLWQSQHLPPSYPTMARVEYGCVTFPLRAVAYPLLCIKCGSPPVLTPLLGTYSISLPKGCQGRCHSIRNSSSHPNSTIQGWIFKSRSKETVSRGGLRIHSTTFLSISISKVWCAKDPSSRYPSSRETRTVFRPRMACHEAVDAFDCIPIS